MYLSELSFLIVNGMLFGFVYVIVILVKFIGFWCMRIRIFVLFDMLYKVFLIDVNLLFFLFIGINRVMVL